MLDLSRLDLRALVHALVDPDLTEEQRWLVRLAVLESAEVKPTLGALAFLGNTTPEKARGAVGVLEADGLAQWNPEE